MYHQLSNDITLMSFSLSTAFTIIEAIATFPIKKKKKQKTQNPEKDLIAGRKIKLIFSMSVLVFYLI